MLFQIVLASAVLLLKCFAQEDGLVVETSTGTVTGIINGSAPDVRQFLSIPYAQAPLGDLRWMPPVPLTTNASTRYDATNFPPSCPQTLSRVPSVYNKNVPAWIPYTYGQNTTAGASLNPTSEDCLQLAIWTPVNATSSSKLPVLFFMTGGAFITNGVYVPIQLPYHFVQRRQDFLFVTINYRLNIFGFPNAAGLNTSQNIGLLDQRAALEWIEQNIVAFGGDPTRITMHGQSAGAVSTDLQNFAFPNNPIASSFYAQSGSVFLPLYSEDFSHTNFSFVASNLGCGHLEPAAELACMRNVSYTEIEDFLASYQDNSTLVNPSQPPISFIPIPDEAVVFSNYTERYANGQYANKSMIYSTCAMEGESLVPYPSLPPIDGNPQTTPPNQTLVTLTTLDAFLCPAALSVRLRNKYNPSVPTFRYLFSGNFSNVSPLFWMGAYHASDLAFIFGTHQDEKSPSGAGSTPLEFNVSDSLQDYVLSLVSDPTGKSAIAKGWSTFKQGMLLDFGNGTSGVNTIDTADIDTQCADYLAQYGFHP